MIITRGPFRIVHWLGFDVGLWMGFISFTSSEKSANLISSLYFVL